MVLSEGCHVLVEQLWTLRALITEWSVAQDETHILSGLQYREEGCMPTKVAHLGA
jgi:hypothetical protein